MANRVIRDWTDSDKVNALSFEAEVFFTRLFMKADDFGSFYSDPRILRTNLFPLRVDTVTDKEVASWLQECVGNGLIMLYEVAGKFYLRIVNFGQRLRAMKGKFPAPLTNDSDSQTSVGSETKQETKQKQETGNEKRKAPEFVNENFIDCYLKWMNYKAKRRETYKSLESEEAFYKKLLKLSGEKCEIASEIIEQSMAQNWAGIFELKTKNHGKTSGGGDKVIAPGKKFGNQL